MTATEINNHLKSGGVVQVTTYLRSTIYNAKHVGWFFDKGDGVYVRSGRGSIFLGHPDRPLVSIRLGRVA